MDVILKTKPFTRNVSTCESLRRFFHHLKLDKPDDVEYLFPGNRLQVNLLAIFQKVDILETDLALKYPKDSELLILIRTKRIFWHPFELA